MPVHWRRLHFDLTTGVCTNPNCPSARAADCQLPCPRVPLFHRTLSVNSNKMPQQLEKPLNASEMSMLRKKRQLSSPPFPFVRWPRTRPLNARQ